MQWENASKGYPVWFPMGVYLPLEQELENRYLVRVAQGDKEKHWETISIAKTQDVIKGYARYSAHAAIKLAKKQIGHLYDWGGRYGGLDCSALIMMVYRCFGWFLPRNTKQQQSIGNVVTFSSNMSLQERIAALAHAQPGDLLYMPGHVAIWLGKKGDFLQIVHASFSAGEICSLSMNVNHKNAQEFLFKLEKINRIS